MGSINSIVISGRLGKDAASKSTNNGKTLTNMSVATDRNYQVNNKWETETTWHNVVAFGLSQKKIEALKKGAEVAVTGRIANRSYEKDGQKKYITEIVADNVELFGLQKADKPAGNQTAAEPQGLEDGFAPSDNDDMPF